ncbi:MAG: hypothetical protein HUU35_17475, partial [Armatimonadetes bacterium]|nr:hypothetical protein [Armatimonadota bacterium]
ATTFDEASGAVVSCEPERPNLAVVPLRREGLTVRSASAQSDPLLGWYCQKDRQPPYLPATTVLHQRGGEGLQPFLTLLLPLKPGAANPVASVRETAAGAEVLLSDGRRWQIEAGADPAGVIGFREILAEGSLGRQVSGG